MRPRTSTLFHFTSSLDNLRSILATGFWPRYCLEDFNWYNPQLSQVAYPMVCFCDIPLSRIDQHVSDYGSYGIGMTKEWGQRNGLNPIQYIAKGSFLFGSISRLIGNHKSQGQYYPGSDVDTLVLLSMIKPMSGGIFKNPGFPPIDFYQECEWRYVPPHAHCPPWITKEQYNDSLYLSEINNKTQCHHSLVIAPNDIKYIFVKEVAEIPELVNFLQYSHGKYPLNENQILMSRIISLEDVRSDL